MLKERITQLICSALLVHNVNIVFRELTPFLFCKILHQISEINLTMEIEIISSWV